MIRTRTISISVDKIAGDTFDAIVKLFPKMIPDTKINSGEWWPLIDPDRKSKMKYQFNRPLGILDYRFSDDVSSWNIPMYVVPNGDFSEVIVVLTKPEQLTDSQFNERVEKINKLVLSMKILLESKP